MGDIWTDERVDTLKTLHAAGLSASRIADQIGGGASRSGVLGKLWRIGLARSAPTAPTKLKPERIEPEKPKRQKPSLPVVLRPREPVKREHVPPVQRPALVLNDGEHVTIATLEQWMCKYPLGDPTHADFHFCGNPRDGERPYCAHHHELAHQNNPSNHNLRRKTTVAQVEKALSR